MKKNSDKSHSSIGMFPHRFGRFLPSVTHLASEKLILPNFSMLRGVAVSVCFPEVRNRKQTESGLLTTKVSPDYILMISSFFDFFGGNPSSYSFPRMCHPHSACFHPDPLIFYTMSFLYDHHLHHFYKRW